MQELLADVLVTIHLAFVGFVILGQAAILVGWVLRWRWIRNPWFRLAHLASIVYVAAEAVLGVPCPLTIWENDLRRAAGQTPDEVSFVGRLRRDVLFIEGVEPETFRNWYVGFAIAVVLTLILAPPRFRRRAKGD